MRKLSSMKKAQGYYYDEHGHLKRRRGLMSRYKMNAASEKHEEVKPVAKKKAPVKRKPAAKKAPAKKAAKK